MATTATATAPISQSLPDDSVASGQQTRGRLAKACQAFQLGQMIALLYLAKQVERQIPRFSAVETTPFIDPRQFKWHELAASEWTKVRSELEKLLSAVDRIPSFQEISEEQKLITNDDKWRTYILYAYGHRFDEHCAECPGTDALLQQIPGMKTAFFSILLPGKQIPPHRGPYRGVLRYHLPLLVPRHGECAIWVGGQVAKWEEGVGIMFDDAYAHAAWNNTQEIRVVLFLDIERPMRFPFNIINSMMIKLFTLSPFVRKARKNQAAWDRALESPIQR